MLHVPGAGTAGAYQFWLMMVQAIWRAMTGHGEPKRGAADVNGFRYRPGMHQIGAKNADQLGREAISAGFVRESTIKISNLHIVS